MSKLVYVLPILVACGDNNAAPVDAPHGDGGEIDAPGGPFTVLASFDPAMGQLPEGLFVVGGAPVVSFAPLGQVAKVKPDKTFDVFGTMPGTVADTFTLGIVAQSDGSLLVGVGASGPNPVPAPGIYSIPAGGGAATLFASNANMVFPNGLDIDGTDLYVADSGAGRVFRVNLANGAVQNWSNDAMLAGDQTACGGSGAGFDIGANGIVHDANFRYVAVTDFGRLVKIPILANGNAGTPMVVTEDCATLAGLDGIALDTDGSILGARNGPSLQIVRVATDGTVTVVGMGAPLDGPASVFLEANNKLLITNSAFFSGASGKPSLVELAL